jgi:hypothetical protein
MTQAKVRWISTTSFEENLRGAYGGGEGANGTEGRVRQGRGARTVQKGARMALEGGTHGCKGGTQGRARVRIGEGRARTGDKGHTRL